MDLTTIFAIIFMAWHLIGLIPLNIIRSDRPKDFKTRTRFILYLLLIGPIPFLCVLVFWFTDYLQSRESNLTDKIRDFFLVN